MLPVEKVRPEILAVLKMSDPHAVYRANPGLLPTKDRVMHQMRLQDAVFRHPVNVEMSRYVGTKRFPLL